MSDISKIKLPNGDVYDIKDDTARDSAASKSSVSYSQTAQSTDNGAYEVGKITVDGTQTTIYGKDTPFYGVCGEAAATVAKTVTCSNFKSLETGITIHVKFTNSNTATNPTLNVNGTGAKSIYRYGTTVPAAYTSWSWFAGAVVSLTYDGSAWIMNDMIGNDNTYDRTQMQTRIYAGTNGVFPYCICALDSNQRMQAMTTTGGTGTTKAFNSSQKFLYPPVVMYHSANSTITNGNVIANAVLYEQFPNLDLRYSSNITTSAGFTQYKPLYIECTFDDNGYWSPTGITQTFAAGKYYILLGCMYSTSIYQLALFAEHPVFYCKTAGTLIGIPDNDTKNTAGSTDTSSKIFLIGATSQAANPQTYSDNEVYTTSGVLTTKKVQVGGGSCTMEYNTTTESLNFVFS